MDIQSLQTHARHVRQDIIKMTAKAGAGHPGGSLSCTDVLVALYFDVMKNVDPADDKNPLRDRFVLSKGHAAPALYGTLCERGYFDEKEFDLFRQLHGILQGHPDIKSVPAWMLPPVLSDRAFPSRSAWLWVRSTPGTPAMSIR